MPTWIYIINRIVLAVRIQMQRIRIIHLSPVGIFCQESSILRIVVSCIQVIKSGALIVDAACVADFIL